ncbi:MAG: hypothetical protein M1834_000417 [Cirrosporium novae-zelandiae]|nr:MAG: hypothetical protein M1834_000417 [Cirrosporium novae-zelandiae]
MDDLLRPLQDAVEGQIDFEGQRLAELIYTILLPVTGLLAFLVGFFQHDIFLTLWIGLAGTALAAFITIPPWPAYNEEPLHWLPAQTGIRGATIIVDNK